MIRAGKLIRKNVFDGPSGTIEYELRVSKEHDPHPRTRDVVVHGQFIGRIVEECHEYWHPENHFGNCGTQYTAAEFVIMWNWIENMSVCPYCNDGTFYDVAILNISQGSSSSVLYDCKKCGAREEHRRWSPETE